MRTRILILTIVLLTAFTTLVRAQDVVISSSQSYTIANAASPSNGTVDKYRWFKDNVLIDGAKSATYTIPAGTALGTYKYVRQAHAKDCDMWVSSNVFTVQVITCHAPGTMATMQNFFPCSNPATNSTWNLTDTRNNVTYKVRLLADGRYWMVDDLKYPTACNKTTFSGSTATGSAGKNGISGFIGDCHNIKNGSTPAARGYLYDWMGAMQDTLLYYGSTSNPNCGTSCQGICPEGWHVPTGNPSTGEFTLLNKAVNNGSSTSDAGLINTSTFSAVYGGYSHNTGSLYAQGSGATYWSSSYINTYDAYHLYFYSTSVSPSFKSNGGKSNGYSLRCIRNY